MNILLTNDDGIHAEGLQTLYSILSEKHNVTVVAPDRERSAVSHAITLHEPLRIDRISSLYDGRGYASNGTPADCVKLGILEICDTYPDMVISGINSGSNVGVSIHYSGTAAAAREAALHGLTAMAVSINGYYKPEHYKDAAVFTASLAAKTFQNSLPFGVFLNVNIPDIPAEEVRGVCLAPQENPVLSENFDKRTDPRDRDYYWLGREGWVSGKYPDTDTVALSRNCISVTPIRCDMTSYEMLEALRTWGIE